MAQSRYLFGGQDRPWKPSQWTSSDDRVRGGKSVSHLTCSGKGVSFHGHLDISTLGGAGFASQRTVDPQTWNLLSYSGLVLDIASADGKKYTVVLKDALLPSRPDGREQSTISWEYDFVAEKDGGQLIMPFRDFKATYRGRPCPDAAPLDLANIKRISFMMRSFFGTQEGDFNLCLKSLACSETDHDVGRVHPVGPVNSSGPMGDEEPPLTEKGDLSPDMRSGSSWLRRWFCCA